MWSPRLCRSARGSIPWVCAGPSRRRSSADRPWLEIGFHEQTRLQPEIQGALDMMPDRDELRWRVLDALFPRAGVLLRLRLRLPRALRRMNPLDRALDRLVDELRRLLRRLVTDILMRLELPGGRVLRLGRGLSRSFPLSLQTVAHPDLREILSRSGRGPCRARILQYFSTAQGYRQPRERLAYSGPDQSGFVWKYHA